MSSSGRQDDLVRLLRRRPDWTIEQLANDLTVSRRTVMRDLDVLRGRGFHITSMTGPGGGVHMEPTSVIISSQLDGTEVVALILSAALARAAPWMPFASGADRALAKIEASLPSRRAMELQRLMQRIMVGDPATTLPGDMGPIDEALVPAFETCFTQDRLLGFRYTDAKGRRTNRRVEPHGLMVRAPLWYVIAWDPAPDAARLFRADRIRNPVVTDGHFVPRPHELVTDVCPDAKPTIGMKPNLSHARR